MKNDESLRTGIKPNGTGKTKANKTSFKKGVSGNPGGRPKKTEQQKEAEKKQEDALEKIKTLAPTAVDVAVSLMHDPETPPAVKVKIIDMILDRTYGKAFQSVAINTESNAETGIVMMPKRGSHE